MSDVIYKQDIMEQLKEICDKRCPYNEPTKVIGACCSSCFIDDIIKIVQTLPFAPEPKIIRCKECKHRPVTNDNYDDDELDCGFNIEFPDYKCPCQCEDAYYNRLPDDNWFCANAERRTDERFNKQTRRDR